MAQYSQGPILFNAPISSVTATKPTDLDLGTKVEFSGNTYRYIYLDGDSDASPGMGLITSANSGYSLTISSTTDKGDPCMGVVKHATLTTATYGWVLVQGFVPLEVTAGSITAIGDNAVLGGNGLFHTVHLATAAIAVQPVAAQFLAVTASAGSAQAYVRCFSA